MLMMFPWLASWPSYTWQADNWHMAFSANLDTYKHESSVLCLISWLLYNMRSSLQASHSLEHIQEHAQDFRASMSTTCKVQQGPSGCFENLYSKCISPIAIVLLLTGIFSMFHETSLGTFSDWYWKIWKIVLTINLLEHAQCIRSEVSSQRWGFMSFFSCLLPSFLVLNQFPDGLSIFAFVSDFQLSLIAFFWGWSVLRRWCTSTTVIKRLCARENCVLGLSDQCPR